MTRLRGLCTGMLAGGIVLLAGACNENRETGAVSSTLGITYDQFRHLYRKYAFAKGD